MAQQSMRFRDAGRDPGHVAQKWGAVIGGSALALYGLTRRSPLGLALAAGGGALAYKGATSTRSTEPPVATSSLLINRSPQDIYQFWRNFENHPQFMRRLESVEVLPNGRSRWVAIGPMNRRVRWEAEIVSERENEYIAWRSLPGSDVQLDGRVDFEPAPADRGTLVNIRIEVNAIPGMRNSISSANFLRKGASFLLRQDLRNLEALLEAGEIPTIEGQSHGPRDFITGVLRVADPTRPRPRGANLGKVFEQRRRSA